MTIYLFWVQMFWSFELYNDLQVSTSIKILTQLPCTFIVYHKYRSNRYKCRRSILGFLFTGQCHLTLEQQITKSDACLCFDADYKNIMQGNYSVTTVFDLAWNVCIWTKCLLKGYSCNLVSTFLVWSLTIKLLLCLYYAIKQNVQEQNY